MFYESLYLFSSNQYTKHRCLWRHSTKLGTYIFRSSRTNRSYNIYCRFSNSHPQTYVWTCSFRFIWNTPNTIHVHLKKNCWTIVSFVFVIHCTHLYRMYILRDKIFKAWISVISREYLPIVPGCRKQWSFWLHALFSVFRTRFMTFPGFSWITETGFPGIACPNINVDIF